ncbi:hypothetical protein [Massilia sp. HP4]|uniref:hypothetical protein n=1 Tax=Massilia sp. HP4 TaxID=2562316 RepID=UPI0010BF8963|nr:hypothetical protein [Massilia sp. HP4]
MGTLLLHLQELLRDRQHARIQLGITLTGFHDNDIDQKAITVFERGRWSDLISELKPFAVDDNRTHRP